MRQRGSSVILIIVLIILLAIVTMLVFGISHGGNWNFSQGANSNKWSLVPPVEEASSSSQPLYNGLGVASGSSMTIEEFTKPAGWKTFTSQDFGFEFYYPPYLVFDNSSTNKWIVLLQKQDGLFSNRMRVDVQPTTRSLRDIAVKEFGYIPGELIYENKNINGKMLMVVKVNTSMKQLCNFEDATPMTRAVGAILDAGENAVVFGTNNSCDTYKNDWFEQIIPTIHYVSQVNG